MNIPTRDRLILHAGMHKTGSTSIQGALGQRNFPGAHYFRLGNDNHSLGCITLFQDHPEDHFAFQRRGMTAEDLAQQKQQLQQKLTRQLRKRPEQTCILSAEWMSVALKDALIRMREQFAPHFHRIEVFGYVRPPGEFLASMLQQGIKTGGGTFNLGWPKYRQRFEKLDDVFGRENVHLRVYTSGALKNADVVEDFADWTGLSLPRQDYKRRNTSMSAAALTLAFCYRRNTQTAVNSPDRYKRDRQIINALMALPSPRFQLSPDLVDKVIADNAEDLDWIEARMGQRLPQGAQTRKPGAEIFDGPESLLTAAARFSPLLAGQPAGEAPQDSAEAEALAWQRLSAFIARLRDPDKG